MLVLGRDRGVHAGHTTLLLCRTLPGSRTTLMLQDPAFRQPGRRRERREGTEAMKRAENVSRLKPSTVWGRSTVQAGMDGGWKLKGVRGRCSCQLAGYLGTGAAPVAGEVPA